MAHLLKPLSEFSFSRVFCTDNMLRFAILCFCSVLSLTVGHLTDPDEWPRLYDDTIVTNLADPSIKQGVSYRLPNDTVPHRYDISLSTRIDLGVFDFDGKVLILLEAKTATSVITVHSKQLTIDQVVLKNARTQATIVTLFKLNVLLEFLEISTAAPLVVGQNYTLEITYKGTLRSDNGGFYRSNYVNEVGMTK
jgi:Peptidase M1 N-terminal domain